jgi:hypothetical protein
MFDKYSDQQEKPILRKLKEVGNEQQKMTFSLDSECLLALIAFCMHVCNARSIGKQLTSAVMETETDVVFRLPLYLSPKAGKTPFHDGV